MTGRWFSEGNNSSTLFAGSSLETNVENTSQVIGRFDYTSQAFSQAPILAISVNDGPLSYKPLAEQVTLATGLSAGKNNIKVYYDGYHQYDSIWGGSKALSLIGLTLSPGGKHYKVTSASKNILYVGDSITTGVRAVAANDDAANSSFTRAFPYLTSKLLNAKSVISAFGGSGVSKTGSGGAPKTIDFVLNNAPSIPVGSDNIHTIVMMVGTNDGSDNSFTVNYQALITKLRTKYPTQRIYILDLFTTPAKRTTELESIASSNTKVTLIRTSGWGTIETTDGLHPTAAGAQQVATKLSQAMITDGWSTGGGLTPAPVNVWAAAGKPSSYTPLPNDFSANIVFDGTTGQTFTISFTASSATNAKINYRTEWRQDLDVEVQLSTTPTNVTRTFVSGYSGPPGNFFRLLPVNGATDIVVTNIKLMRL